MKKKISKSNIARKNITGFTLIEVLILIAIVSIVAAVIIIAINPGRQLAQGRNAQRTSDISEIQNAIKQYYVDNDGSWPSQKLSGSLTEICATGTTAGDGDTDDTEGSCVDLSELVPDYLRSIPADPQGGYAEGGNGYHVSKTGTELALTADKSTEYSLPGVSIGAEVRSVDGVIPPSYLTYATEADFYWRVTDGAVVDESPNSLTLSGGTPNITDDYFNFSGAAGTFSLSSGTTGPLLGSGFGGWVMTKNPIYRDQLLLENRFLNSASALQYTPVISITSADQIRNYLAGWKNSSGTVSRGQWVHIFTVIWNDSGTYRFKFYINGADAGSAASSYFHDRSTSTMFLGGYTGDNRYNPQRVHTAYKFDTSDMGYTDGWTEEQVKALANVDRPAGVDALE